MKTNRKSTLLFGGIATTGLIILAVYVYSTRGYGEVSPRAYEFAKALYGACLAESEERLDRVDRLLNDESEQANAELPEQERRWLNRIVRTAQDGHWQTAAKRARRMMEDQVEY